MIHVENLTKQFDKRGIAGLHGLSFSLKEGKVLGILGPNGSGKTTLLKILSGSIQADKGHFSTDGDVVFFPSNAELPRMNVQKYLVESVTLDINDEKKIQLARDLADTFEFTFQLRQNLNELSSGQKQKVLLSKELINRPALLLMDEPFTHLDPFTRKDILTGLFEYIRNQGTTVLWVTHDLEEAFRFSDQLGLMNFGKFEQFSTPEDMVQNPRNLFVAQFMGYRNFFSIKFQNNSWVSPWGNLALPPHNKEDAVLVVPDHAWEIKQEGIQMTVKKRFAGKQCIEYHLESATYKIFLTRGPKLALLDIDSQIHLSPLLNECFLIPL